VCVCVCGAMDVHCALYLVRVVMDPQDNSITLSALKAATACPVCNSS